MMCRFCHQDVDQPCQDRRDVEQRAEVHVDRCEAALKDGEASQEG